jgi:hypothetical protein
LTARGVFLLLAAASVALPARAGAQESALAITVAAGAPIVVVGQVLDESGLEEALRSGLPLRIRIRVELWRDRAFDQLVDQVGWTQVLAFEPMAGQFLIGRPGENTPDRYPSYAAARAVLETLYRPRLRATAPGRYYYLATLEIESLSLSDLEELGQWLRGEVAPAARGRRSPAAALGTGLRRALIRILALPTRRYEARSDHFMID